MSDIAQRLSARKNSEPDKSLRDMTEKVDPWLAFVARVQARAILFDAGDFGLHEAVDPLQLYAEDSGLIDQIGQDAVQWTMAHVFEPVRS